MNGDDFLESGCLGLTALAVNGLLSWPEAKNWSKYA